MSTDLNPSKPWKPAQVPYAEPGTSESYYGSSLEQRPDHARLIGLIIASWSHIERRLSEAFSYIPDASDWAAAFEIQKHRNLQPKIAKTLQGVREKFGPEAEDHIRKTLRRASDIKKERDKVAHASFMLRSSRPDGIIRLDGWGKDQKCYLYTLETLQALLAELYTTEQQLGDIQFAIMIRHRPEQYASGRYAFPAPLTAEQIREHFPALTQDDQPPREGKPPQNDPEGY